MANFFNDIASEEDYLGYNPYIEAFNYILTNNNDLITPPLVFGIHGKWGSGKTTFMNLIKSRIEKEKKFYTVEINPWEYGHTQNFITIFVAKLYQEVKNKVRYFGDESGLDFIKAIFTPLKLTLDLKPIKAEYDFNKFSLDQQQDTINKYISENFALKESISYILNHDFISNKKIVIFIDDLDRCSVDKVMEVIESIKLIFNSNNCIFFLGCDINYLQSALSNKYESFIKFSKENKNDVVNFDLNDFSREYLEKIIQIPFYMPSIDGKAIKRYIWSILEHRKTPGRKLDPKENIFENFKKDLKDDFISDLIIATDINPRRIKRILNLTFLNYVFMKFKNIEKNNLMINTKLLAFLCIIREVYPKFYKEKLSYELAGRKTFERFFEIYDNEKKDSGKLFGEALAEFVKNIKDNNINTSINSKNSLAEDLEEINKDNSNKNLYEKVYSLFELYFKDRDIKSSKKLNEEIYHLSLYISVSNLNVSENETESEWGELAQIKSDITGKKLIIFLEMLSENSPAKNLIYWFFYNVYSKKRDKYILGIVKNVNIYIKTDGGREWAFRFDYNKRSNNLEIVFEWRNEYKSIISNLNEIIKSKKYNPINKKIEVSEETTLDELEKIKDDLIRITAKLDYLEENEILNSNEEIASTEYSNN
ncbi:MULTISPECIES: P-loop NTPase fold protein [Clostridium]|uniref:KAP family P-loop NTPase fold protein n=1 Tax=Clostridium TaxID=1485 RepID=UPI00149499FB|nr:MULTISPECIES: P-loop NTPase fold protein [Clostridium]NOW91079.1 hypothetical protein [Clostridium beijerinckii]